MRTSISVAFVALLVAVPLASSCNKTFLKVDVSPEPNQLGVVLHVTGSGAVPNASLSYTVKSIPPDNHSEDGSATAKPDGTFDFRWPHNTLVSGSPPNPAGTVFVNVHDDSAPNGGTGGIGSTSARPFYSN